VLYAAEAKANLLKIATYSPVLLAIWLTYIFIFCFSLICHVTPDKCCSQKCAALRVQSVGVGWLSIWPVGNTAIAVFRAWPRRWLCSGYV